MSDLVERLRDYDPIEQQLRGLPIQQEAADEIERLRAALQDIVDCVTHDYSRRDIQAAALAALENNEVSRGASEEK